MKSEKFKELAEKRVNNAIDEIRKIGNLGNKSRYEYTDKQVKQIFVSLESSIKEAKVKFSGERESSLKFKFEE